MYLLLLPLTLAVGRGVPACDEESGALHLLQAKGHYVLAADKKILKGVSHSACTEAPTSMAHLNSQVDSYRSCMILPCSLSPEM